MQAKSVTRAEQTRQKPRQARRKQSRQNLRRRRETQWQAIQAIPAGLHGDIHDRKPRQNLRQALQATSAAGKQDNICGKQSKKSLKQATPAKYAANKVCGKQSKQNPRQAIQAKSAASNPGNICGRVNPGKNWGKQSGKRLWRAIQANLRCAIQAKPMASNSSKKASESSNPGKICGSGEETMQNLRGRNPDKICGNNLRQNGLLWLANPQIPSV